MKIKEVCAQTALTDRAIRYYIDEGLLAPAATQNYAGRRALDFSEEDVATLNAIATLRKFGFTVEEIRRILADPAESVAILADVQQRKAETVRQEQTNLDALARLDSGRGYTAHELAAALTEPVREVAVPREDRAFSWKEKLVRWLKAAPVIVMVSLPVVVCMLVAIALLLLFRYPVIDTSMILPYLFFTGVSLLPVILWGLGWLVWFRKGRGSVLRVFLAVVCLLWLPVTVVCQSLVVFGPPVQSLTENPRNYLKVDSQVAMDEMLFDLFPAQPHTLALTVDEEGFHALQPMDMRYYYLFNACIDEHYEVIAEWTLTPAELEAEVQRLEALMADCPTYMTVERQQRGGYELLLCYEQDAPFSEWMRYYTQAIFAWDEKTGRVRYIYTHGVDVQEYQQPTYPTLPW